MRAVVQRVRQASVSVDGRTVGAIGRGLVVLLGVGVGDAERDAEYLADKVLNLRVFPDDAGVMNRSLQDVGGAILAVSQFTLYASTRKGNRPSYSAAAPPAVAQPEFDRFVVSLARELGAPVATGEFGAHMAVELVNDGPVTLWLDSRLRE